MSSPPSAWLPPPNYSHTPPPRAGSLQARGRRARASPASGRREGGGEAGRQGGRHPSSQPPSARRPTAPPPAGSAPGTLRVRARLTHLPADCGIRRAGGGVGAVLRVGFWSYPRRPRLGRGRGPPYRAQPLLSHVLSLTCLPVKGSGGLEGQGDLKCQILLTIRARYLCVLSSLERLYLCQLNLGARVGR